MSAASKCDQCGVYADTTSEQAGRSRLYETPDGWLDVQVAVVQMSGTCHGEFCSFACASEWLLAEGAAIEHADEHAKALAEKRFTEVTA